MATLNELFLIGNLTRDPESRVTSSGKNLTSFTLAVNEPKSADKQPEVSFVDCIAFSKTAELISKYVTKGSPILVRGRLHQNRWEQEGQKRSKIEVIVLGVQFLGSKKDGTQGTHGTSDAYEGYPDSPHVDHGSGADIPF